MFVGGNGDASARMSSRVSTEFTGDSFDMRFDPDRSGVVVGTSANSDNTVTVGVPYSNYISEGNANVITDIPDELLN